MNGNGRQCNHTLDHTNPDGTWKVVSGAGGQRKVLCGACGRFFGYIRPQSRSAGKTHFHRNVDTPSDQDTETPLPEAASDEN